MPAQIVITLDDESISRLNLLLSSRKTSKAIELRANIILQAAQGIPNYMIAEALSTSAKTVRCWRNRAAAEGIDCILRERPRGGVGGGKDPAGQEKLRAQIIQKTTTEEPQGQSHWSTRTMAKAVGTTHSFVNRVWQNAGLKPHLNKSSKLSNDPLFEEKLVDVVGLYINPPQKAVVFCVDEKSSIQALDRTQPSWLMKRGQCETMTHDHRRHGTSTLFAGLHVATGDVIEQGTQKLRHQEFLTFIKKLAKEVDANLDLHIIVDNYATHKHEKVRNWLKRNPRVQLHFIPTSSSWLNMVERFFGLITDKAIRRGVFSRVLDLEAKMEEFIEAHNEDPKPFKWTASVEKTLD